MKWIDRAEQLPSDGQEVMVYQSYPPDTVFNCLAYPLNRCFHRIAQYSAFYSAFINEATEPYKHVTHWMPLPDKPEKVK